MPNHLLDKKLRKK